MLDLQNLPPQLWVTGTDTGVGKTYVAAMIARSWAKSSPVVYRKPFQTGVLSEDDPDADAPVVRGHGITTETGVILRAPLSPMAAAIAEERALDLKQIKSWVTRPVPDGTRLLLEPAGGVMVPLAPGIHFAAWAADLMIPAIVVARGGLGTLNHTLLTCEALMLRGWTIPAVILNPGPEGHRMEAEANAGVLRDFLPVPVHVMWEP